MPLPNPVPNIPPSSVSAIDFPQLDRGKLSYIKFLTTIHNTMSNHSLSLVATAKPFMPPTIHESVIIKPNFLESKFLHMFDHRFKDLQGKFISPLFEDYILPLQLGLPFKLGMLPWNM